MTETEDTWHEKRGKVGWQKNLDEGNEIGMTRGLIPLTTKYASKNT